MRKTLELVDTATSGSSNFDYIVSSLEVSALNALAAARRLAPGTSFMVKTNLRIGMLADRVEVDVHIGVWPPDTAAARAQLELREHVGGRARERGDFRHRNLEEPWFAAPYDQLAVVNRGRRDEFLLGTASA
jgi:hypothetical protein